MGKNRKRRGFFVFTLVVVQIVVVLVAIEIAVRVLASHNRTVRTLTFNAAFSSNWATKNTLEELMTATSFGYQPFYPVAGFKLNSKGFRTGEYAEQKVKGTYRICVFGDSFAFASGGVPYPRMWPTLLEKNLKKTVSQNIEVINLGVMAVGPTFEFRLWQLEGSKLDADLVVLAFFVGNDFVDGSRVSASGSSFGEKIAAHSYLVRLVRNWLRYRKAEAGEADARRRIEELTGSPLEDEALRAPQRGDSGERRAGLVGGYRYEGDTDKFSPQSYNKMVSERMRIVEHTYRDYFDRLFEPVANVLLDFRKAVTSTGADFLVMLIPDDYQVNPEVFKEAVDYQHKYPIDFDVDLPQNQLKEFFDANDIDYLDLLPAFRERGKSTVLYRPRDSHWNIAGNGFAAKLLADKLVIDHAHEMGADSGPASE